MIKINPVLVLLALALALSACTSDDAVPDPVPDVAIDRCDVVACVIDGDLVVTAHYDCAALATGAKVGLIRVYASAYVDVVDGVFEFGSHVQFVACGSYLVLSYLIIPGISPDITYAGAGFREGQVHCDSRAVR